MITLLAYTLITFFVIGTILAIAYSRSETKRVAASYTVENQRLYDGAITVLGNQMIRRAQLERNKL